MVKELSELLDEQLDTEGNASDQKTEPSAPRKKIKPLPSRNKKADLQAEEQQAEEGGFAPWQTVIWREWCRSQDDTYAYYLFELVKQTAFGQRFVIILAVLGVLAGGLVGYLIGSLFASAGIRVGPWDLSTLSVVVLTWLSAMAGGVLGVEGSRRFRNLYFWWQGQPSASRVESALHQAVRYYPGAEQVWAKPLRLLNAWRQQQPDPEQLITILRSDDWTERFAARKVLVSLGGEAVSALLAVARDRSDPLWETAVWLLASIEQETTNRFAWRADQTVCPTCLTQFKAQAADVTLGVSFNYYGCRNCSQSRKFLYLPRGVVAILDTHWKQELAGREGLLQVNWPVRRTLFDFDWVEIVRATDEDVERFAVQIGNDTDPFRRSRYRQMTCLIDPACPLSENTQRILRRTFGSVKQGKIDG